MYLRIINALLLFFSSAPASLPNWEARRRCENYLVRVNGSLAQKLVINEFNLDGVQARVKHFGTPFFWIRLLDHEQFIVELQASAADLSGEDAKNLIPYVSPGLPPEYLGKGVGTLLYLVSAAICRIHGFRLISSKHPHSDAVAVWSRLHEGGLARRLAADSAGKCEMRFELLANPVVQLSPKR